MSGKDLPAELLERVLRHHERGTLQRTLDDADEAKRLLDAGRKKGQEANQRNAAMRRAFMEQVARAKKAEYPYMLASSLAAEVTTAIRSLGTRARQHGFRLDKLPKESSICRFIEKLGICVG